MLKHYPDKPVEQSPDVLSKLDRSSNYIAQQKIDGWRMIIILTKDRVEFISRHNKNHTQDIEPEIKLAANELYQHFPLETQLDTEWLSRRSCSKEYNLPPKLFLLDILRYGTEWLISKPYNERHLLIENAIKNLKNRQWIDEPLTALPGTFVEFYEQQKLIPYSEGVVAKHKNFKMIASRKESVKNPLLAKIKFRAGCDGKMTVEHLRKFKNE